MEPGGVNQGASTIHLFWVRASISGNVGDQAVKITLTLTGLRLLLPHHLSSHKEKKTLDKGQSQKKTPGWVEPGGVNQGASTIHLFWVRASISGQILLKLGDPVPWCHQQTKKTPGWVEPGGVNQGASTIHLFWGRSSISGQILLRRGESVPWCHQQTKKTPGWVEPGGVNQGASTIHLFWGRSSISGQISSRLREHHLHQPRATTILVVGLKLKSEPTPGI